MLTTDNSGKKLSAILTETALGTCTYTIQIIEAGTATQIIHTVKAVGGVKVQWVEASLNLLDWETNALDKISAKAPLVEKNEDGTPKVKWA